MKPYKTGVVIGKFMPFHNGHRGMISQAVGKVGVLTVIVCHADSYSILPQLRRRWIRSVFPEVAIQIMLHDKRLDSMSTAVSAEWATKTIQQLGFVPDVVFSSEDYGPRYAELMGSEHVMYDKGRSIFDISGMQIREDPFRHWHMIDANVKAYYCKRIVVVGAESTGTTTLARDLAKHYGTTWVPEYGRLYASAQMFGEAWSTGDFIRIAKMQNLMEDTLARQGNKVLVCDTDSFATSVWHERYMGFRSLRVQNLSIGRNVALYVLTDVDVPFVQDGTRDGEHIRDWMTGAFAERLVETGREFIWARGSREERVASVAREIDVVSEREDS